MIISTLSRRVRTLTLPACVTSSWSSVTQWLRDNLSPELISFIHLFIILINIIIIHEKFTFIYEIKYEDDLFTLHNVFSYIQEGRLF